MLRPEHLDRLPNRMVQLYSKVEIDILVDMAQRIKPFMDFVPTAQWQYKKLIEMGNLHSHIVKTLSAIMGITTHELMKLMEEASMEALAFDDDIYRKVGLDPPPLAASPALQKILNQGLQATGGMFYNLTATTANTATRQFEKALDRAYLQVSSGAFSRQQAVRDIVKSLAGKGLAAITYPTGYTDYMDVAVRRAVLTGVNQTALRLQEARADEMGCDLVEVSAHAGARFGEGIADHAGWQGKIYRRSGQHPKYPDFKSSTGYGSGAGLGGWNCRHSFYPFYEGVSEPAYTPAELEKMNMPKYKHNGEDLTEYEATQIQRKIERNIRRWKRERAMMEAAGEPADEAAAKLAKWRERQRGFLQQTGLKRQYDREVAE